jgi:tetratricopeptide (TPR) repeat protein
MMPQLIENSKREPDVPATSASTTQVQAPERVPERASDRRIVLLWKRGILLEKMARSADARENWLLLLQFEPAHLGALNRLGDLLLAAGEEAEAQRIFAEAIAKHPGDALSRVQLAKLLIKDRQYETAREHLDHALTLDPNYRPAHAGLAFILPCLGEPELAAWHGRIAFHGRCIVAANYRGDQPPVTVLELISTHGGNVRIQNFLSDRVFQRYLVTAEFYDPSTPLPPHQLVVNAIGDADLASDALAGAQSLLAHTTAPVINPPAAVLATGRAAVAQRLAAVPGIRTARTVTLSRAALAAPDAQDMLAARGFVFPLLLRSPGFHGGEHFLRVDIGKGLSIALDSLPGGELMVIEYLDARSRDGKFRKYRAMMIDGQLYPLHCAIGSHWKIHYFSAEMADYPEHRAEDAAFLADMTAVLGPRAMAALCAIQATLDLDYGGIDFGLGEDGDVLLFEANATMVILPPDPDPRWDYRRPAVERVCGAVHRMLAARAGVGLAAMGYRT